MTQLEPEPRETGKCWLIRSQGYLRKPETSWKTPHTQLIISDTPDEVIRGLKYFSKCIFRPDIFLIGFFIFLFIYFYLLA